MNYILKYKVKSKYLGFTREEYKEFDDWGSLVDFVYKNKLWGWKLYKRIDDFTVGDNNENNN